MSEEICPICHEQLHNDAPNGIYTVTNCGHQYHTECIHLPGNIS